MALKEVLLGAAVDLVLASESNPSGVERRNPSAGSAPSSTLNRTLAVLKVLPMLGADEDPCALNRPLAELKGI